MWAGQRPQRWALRSRSFHFYYRPESRSGLGNEITTETRKENQNRIFIGFNSKINDIDFGRVDTFASVTPYMCNDHRIVFGLPSGTPGADRDETGLSIQKLG